MDACSIHTCLSYIRILNDIKTVPGNDLRLRRSWVGRVELSVRDRSLLSLSALSARSCAAMPSHHQINAFFPCSPIDNIAHFIRSMCVPPRSPITIVGVNGVNTLHCYMNVGFSSSQNSCVGRVEPGVRDSSQANSSYRRPPCLWARRCPATSKQISYPWHFFFGRTSSSGAVIPEARRHVGIAVPRSSDPALILIWTLTDPMGIAKIVCRPYRARAYETRARLLVIGVLRAHMAVQSIKKCCSRKTQTFGARGWGYNALDPGTLLRQETE
ncbi:hypothetical protein HETIRDRAFT_432879 [Heterobasidion irregulare TC 32-1]|uniref:Uncharacterized protein n=1 Tax=Heterobasidion irregulare (strain TC 32-1) TaxID=747525 RepID=W4KDJ8_HETIT|nr:uncharacterized protein HETIRDRAFT_432879 [Heterobasidion irregulare TC 32-1]ETW83809.1 hypothetical protein HETIRDRAFT_432879 [Heterobasidion irregulare TC 32-1]